MCGDAGRGRRWLGLRGERRGDALTLCEGCGRAAAGEVAVWRSEGTETLCSEQRWLKLLLGAMAVMTSLSGQCWLV